MEKAPNISIRTAYDALRRQSKDDLIRQFPSRLDMSHMRSEPKGNIISAILEAKFGRKALNAWNGK